MCLKTKNPTIKIAKKDIYVFKDCYIRDENTCTPEFYGYDYVKNELTLRVVLSLIDDGKFYRVEAGYHSYNIPNAVTNTVFKIPKGTEYVNGWYNGRKFLANRVSSNIIYLGEKKYTKTQRFLIKLGLLKVTI